jgi:alkylation response protein AidB-like acyl-CoA dehydrogenase
VTDDKKPLKAARELRETIDRHAREGDGTTIARECVDQLVAANLYAVMTPRDVGGLELPLLDALDVYAELSRADGSTGWCVMASGTLTAYFGAYTSASFVERMFADGVPLAAGQFAPNGVAKAEGDGYRISGRYSFGSNIDHATWIGAGAMTVPEPGSGEDPDLLFAVMPADRVRLEGNWEVLGLGATSSQDYSIDDVFVPADATFRFFAPERHRGGPVYDLGVLALTTIGHAGFAVGVIRRALDELAALAKTKHRMGASAPLQQSEPFLLELGTLESRFHAAHAWLREVVARAERKVADSGAADPADVNRMRQATVFLTQEGGDIVRHAYLAAGTSGLRRGPIERCFRDMHAGTQHFFASPASTLDMARDVLAAAPELALDAE